MNSKVGSFLEAVESARRQASTLVSGYKNAEKKLESYVGHLYALERGSIHDTSSSWIPDDLIKDERSEALDVASVCVGLAFGRFNPKVLNDAPEELTQSAVTDQLPQYPPALLRNEERLPEVRLKGVLVDDPGHPDDIVESIATSFRILWKNDSERAWEEMCNILGYSTGGIRSWVRRDFFVHHIKQYSESKRIAPIYWPIATPSGSYTLWLYYHRLTDQILYTCVNDYIDPKLTQVAEDANRLRQKTGRNRNEERELEKLTDLEKELQEFRAELLRIAKFWKPNLNDGVQITAAPLWKLFQHRQWQRRLRETWEKLEAGEYDWAHLAYSIWPDRVRQKCKTDKSLAIAHGLEELYEEPKTPPRRRASRNTQQEEDRAELFDSE